MSYKSENSLTNRTSFAYLIVGMENTASLWLLAFVSPQYSLRFLRGSKLLPLFHRGYILLD